MAQLTPADIGLPPKYSSWRPGQWAAVDKTVASEKRFIANCAPTGSGKSGYYIGASLLGGGRAMSLTSTKALQDQLYNDFSVCGMVDMRGRGNYHCLETNGGTCSDGRVLGCRNSGCAYRADYAEFLKSQLPVTNYAYFFAANAVGEGVGEYDVLNCDEAHAAVQELSSAIEIHLNHHTYEMAYHWLSAPPKYTSISEYRTWAKWLMPKAETKLRELKTAGDHRHLHLIDSFKLTIERIANVPEGWILDESSKDEAVFAPLWPTDFANPLLFRKTPHIVLTSATIVPKTLQLLNIPQEESLFLSQDYVFDPRRSPVYLYSMCRIDHKTTDAGMKQTIAMMDRLIGDRLDRKGLIHPVSYDRQEFILEHSEHRGIMITPRKSSELKEALVEFRQSEPPRILMNPAITTGYDFPMSQAEYQFIFKVPFIDQRPPIMKARAKADPEYLPYLTAQTLVQTCGRIMRGPDDQSETFILDAHAKWFTGPSTRNGYRHLFPSWFMRQIQWPDRAPVPPPPLLVAA